MEERNAIGIGDGLVRISAGLENIEDILEDVAQALKSWFLFRKRNYIQLEKYWDYIYSFEKVCCLALIHLKKCNSEPNSCIENKMKRSLFNDLAAWKISENRKPLIFKVQGR